MRWKGKVFVDTVLPFGLRSAPKIFNALADAAQWIMGWEGIDVLHYLDDFLFFGPPDMAEGRAVLGKGCQVLTKLGFPIAAHKTEGPGRTIVFLGIVIDAEAGVLRLPEEKLLRLQRTIREWGSRKTCTKRQLLSLIGQLQHACCVVRPGRSFLRRMIDLSKSVRSMERVIRLNVGFRSDLQWWSSFLHRWNGVGMMAGAVQSRWSVMVTSDASGSWGCGAYTSSGEWFQFEWPKSWDHVHITVKELVPVLFSIATWGKMWSGQTVRCRCDNAAVVAIVNSGRTKMESARHLMRALFFITANYNITLSCSHIPGVDNGAADALSRDNVISFVQQVPEARSQPSILHQGLIQALIHQKPDWTTRDWFSLMQDIFQEV